MSDVSKALVEILDIGIPLSSSGIRNNFGRYKSVTVNYHQYKLKDKLFALQIVAITVIFNPN